MNAQREYVWSFASTFIRSVKIGGEGDELIDEVCNSVISVNKNHPISRVLNSRYWYHRWVRVWRVHWMWNVFAGRSHLLMVNFFICFFYSVLCFCYHHNRKGVDWRRMRCQQVSLKRKQSCVIVALPSVSFISLWNSSTQSHVHAQHPDETFTW